MANSDEIRSRHKRQHQVLRVPQGLWTSYGKLYTTEKRDRILNITRIPPAFHISREPSPESDQLRLHRHSAISPLGHSARSHAAHLDEFVYSGQGTLPEESDQLRLHCHSAISTLGHNAGAT